MQLLISAVKSAVASPTSQELTKAISGTIASAGSDKSLNHLGGVWSRFYNALYTETLVVWPHVLTGIFILLIFWLLARLAHYIIERMSRRAKRRKEIYHLLGKCAKVSILIFGLITALGTMGVDITALVTGLGLTGFAIGLALKDPISNAISGFMVLFYEPFHVGDKIIFSDNEGIVKDIQLRYTILLADGKHFLIPNAILLTNVITVDDTFSAEPDPDESPPAPKRKRMASILKKKSRNHKSS